LLYNYGVYDFTSIIKIYPYLFINSQTFLTLLLKIIITDPYPRNQCHCDDGNIVLLVAYAQSIEHMAKSMITVTICHHLGNYHKNSIKIILNVLNTNGKILMHLRL